MTETAALANCFICSQAIRSTDDNVGFGYTADEVTDPFTADWHPIPGNEDKAFHRDCAEDHGHALGLHEA